MARPIRSLLRSLAPVAVLTAVLLGALPAIASAAEPVFQFTGRGFGHGVGMSQWGAKGMAEQGWTHQRILAHYFRTSRVAPWAGATTIRVNLDPAASSGAGSYTKTTWHLAPAHAGARLTVNGVAVPATGAYHFVASGASIRVYNDTLNTLWKTLSGTVSVGETGVPVGAPALVKVVEGSGWGAVANRLYRGSVDLTASTAGKIKLINRLGVEGYIYGVIPLETGYTWGEATEAQAVAARGYALTSSGELYCTTSSQVYGGYSVEKAQSNAAADATRGEVVWAYDPAAGKDIVIRTYFFSTSGGYTESVENVWGGVAKPYFAGVADPYEFQAGSSRHIWSASATYDGEACRTASNIRSKMVAHNAATAGDWDFPVPATLTDIVVTKRGVSGRALEIVLKGATASTNTTLSGRTAILQFAGLFGWGDTWFYVTRFSWDVAAAKLGSGGSVTVGFHVSGAPASVMNGQIKGLIKDGVNTGKVLTVTDGAGTVTLTGLGKYWVDGAVYNTAGNPDPSKGDMRGTQWYVRNSVYAVAVSAAPVTPPAPPVVTAPGAWALTAVGLSNRVDLRWTKPTGALAFRLLVSTAGFAGSVDATGFRTVYDGAALAASDLRAVNGTTHYYTAFNRNSAGKWSAAATVSVRPAPLTVPTKLTIKAAPTSVRLPTPFILSGNLTPGVNGDGVVAEVKKPGSGRWSYSSLRLTYNGTSWWYRYGPKLRGTYQFRARFNGGGGRKPAVSTVISVIVR